MRDETNGIRMNIIMITMTNLEFVMDNTEDEVVSSKALETYNQIKADPKIIDESRIIWRLEDILFPFVDEDDTCYSVWRIVEVLKTEEIDMYHDGFTDSCITADVINKMLYGCC